MRKPPVTEHAAQATNWLVRAECKNGHVQEVNVRRIGRKWAEAWAGLMDGTSPLYPHNPHPDSAIGKCGICGARIACSVLPVERKDGKPRVSRLGISKREILEYALIGYQSKLEEIEAAISRVRSVIAERVGEDAQRTAHRPQRGGDHPGQGGHDK